jgi:hypothetical protein
MLSVPPSRSDWEFTVQGLILFVLTTILFYSYGNAAGGFLFLTLGCWGLLFALMNIFTFLLFHAGWYKNASKRDLEGF